MISMSAVSFTQVYGIYWLFGSISGLLGGAFVPLNMLPQWAVSVVGLLPFQFAYYVPLSVINGHLPAPQALSLMPQALFWVALLGCLAYLQWRYTRRHIDAAGV
jgi:ABC-2 type transport system permease protein